MFSEIAASASHPTPHGVEAVPMRGMRQGILRAVRAAAARARAYRRGRREEIRLPSV